MTETQEAQMIAETVDLSTLHRDVRCLVEAGMEHSAKVYAMAPVKRLRVLGCL